MKFISIIVFFVLLSHNSYGSTFTHELLTSNKKIGLSDSLFYLKKIESLDSYTNEKSYEGYVIFSKTDNSFQLVLENNIRSFTIYLSSLDNSHFVICNNFASKENILTIYQLLDKEPYLKKIYQTPESNNDRVSWEVYEWKKDHIILKSNSEEGKSDKKTIYFHSTK
ncbi:hypothetical protein [Akkermansia sp.]|uniref:hypothetical protein n=1 Tax=Akkermansia sp. TaxID=1872421 RepID=UPI0039945102